jgi:gas vesicle protein
MPRRTAQEKEAERAAQDMAVAIAEQSLTGGRQRAQETARGALATPRLRAAGDLRTRYSIGDYGFTSDIDPITGRPRVPGGAVGGQTPPRVTRGRATVTGAVPPPRVNVPAARVPGAPMSAAEAARLFNQPTGKAALGGVAGGAVGALAGAMFAPKVTPAKQTATAESVRQQRIAAEKKAAAQEAAARKSRQSAKQTATAKKQREARLRAEKQAAARERAAAAAKKKATAAAQKEARARKNKKNKGKSNASGGKTAGSRE